MIHLADLYLENQEINETLSEDTKELIQGESIAETRSNSPSIGFFAQEWDLNIEQFIPFSSSENWQNDSENGSNEQRDPVETAQETGLESLTNGPSDSEPAKDKDREASFSNENGFLITAPKDKEQFELVKDIREMLSHYQRASAALDAANSIQNEQLLEAEQQLHKKSEVLAQTSVGRFFSHFYHMCMEHLANRKLFHKFTFAVIPNLSYKQRTSFMDALWEKSLLKKKRRALLYSYVNQKSLLAAKSRDLVFKKIEADFSRREKALRTQKLKKEREAMQEELNQKRKEFEEIVMTRKKKKGEEEELLREMKEKQEKNYQKHVKAVQEIAKEFQETKEKNKTVEAEQKKQAEMEEKQKMRRYIQINKPKIIKRNDQAVKKVTYLASVKIRKEEEEKKERERIKEAVENYASRPNPQRDPYRLRQETEALSLKKQTGMDKADKVVLFKNDGFTVDGLMKDVRFKIGAALAVI